MIPACSVKMIHDWFVLTIICGCACVGIRDKDWNGGMLLFRPVYPIKPLISGTEEVGNHYHWWLKFLITDPLYLDYFIGSNGMEV